MPRLSISNFLDLSPFTALSTALAVWVSYKLIQRLQRRVRSTPLAGPPNPSYIFGVGRFLSQQPDPALVYEQWAEKYGPVYRIPATVGYTRIVLCDPKAVQHFYSRETFGYVQTQLTKRSIENLVCFVSP